MSKALSFVGKVAGVVASVAMFIPGGQPVAAIASLVAVTANVGAQLTANTSRPPIQGSVTDITIGADQRSLQMIGDTYVGGKVAHKTGYGDAIAGVPNPYLAMPVIYSVGGPITAADQYLADFQPVIFGGDGWATGYFSEILHQQTYLGGLLQSTALAGPWGAIPGWGSDAKLSGKAHVLWSAKWDSKNGKYTSGLPQLGIRGRGVPTWDPRKDSTYPGGSGPQRWADPADRAAFDAALATWAYTFRPGLHALRYALGSWERDLTNPTSDYVLTFGLGFRLDQVVVEDFVELENICEANGWEVSGVPEEPGDKAANLKRILAAGGAEIAWKGGRLGLKISTPRVSLDTIRRDDLAGDISAPGMLPWRDRINAVIPKYRSPDHKWELQQSDKIVLASAVAEDGEEKLREEPFEYVKVAKQAAELATYALYDAREFGPVEIAVGPRLRRYHAGDRLTLEAELVDALGLPHGEVKVIQRAFDPMTMTGTLIVMGETAAKHAAALGQVGTPPAPIVLPDTGDYDGTATTPRAVYRFLERSPRYPLTSDDTSITIAAITGTLDDSTAVSLPAASKTGLTTGTYYRIFWDRDAPGYLAILDAAIAPYMASPRYIYIDRQATLTGGAEPTDDTPPPGWGGGGGLTSIV